MAVLATGDADDAFDIVQEAMMKLVEKYAHKDPGEWAPLFYRTLQSRISDWHRRRKVRSVITSVWPFRNDTTRHDNADPPLSIEEVAAAPAATRPDRQSENAQSIERVILALERLPLRQQQAFLLRIWEGMDVRETAIAMSCSQGSVKTHLSRAMRSLREYIDAEGLMK